MTESTNNFLTKNKFKEWFKRHFLFSNKWTSIYKFKNCKLHFTAFCCGGGGFSIEKFKRLFWSTVSLLSLLLWLTSSRRDWSSQSLSSSKIWHLHWWWWSQLPVWYSFPDRPSLPFRSSLKDTQPGRWWVRSTRRLSSNRPTRAKRRSSRRPRGSGWTSRPGTCRPEVRREVCSRAPRPHSRRWSTGLGWARQSWSWRSVSLQERSLRRRSMSCLRWWPWSR